MPRQQTKTMAVTVPLTLSFTVSFCPGPTTPFGGTGSMTPFLERRSVTTR